MIHDYLTKDIQDTQLFREANDLGIKYLEQVKERNVFPTEEALSDLNQFEEELQNHPVPTAEIIRQLNTYGAPATVATMGPRYYGFVTGGVIPASLAAKTMTAYWDQVAAMQVISPVAAKLEKVVERWLVKLFKLPESAVAGFVSGTSMANFCALAAARYTLLKRKGWDVNEQGLHGAPKIRVIASVEAHSTVVKAISLVGLGKSNVEWVESDDQGRISTDQIPELDDRSLLILQAGNVNTGSFDSFKTICKTAEEKGAWVHVDGAFGLWTQASAHLQHLTDGIEMAHSWAADGHKTLNTPYDSGIVLCRDKEALVSALHMSGGYIITGDERDGMFFTPEMSRRARIFEMWAAMKNLGVSGLDDMITGFYERAVQFGDEVQKIEGFEVVHDIVFNQVLVQCNADELTERVTARVQDMRECWVGGSTWKGRKVIRVSICNWNTTAEDITRSVDSFKKALSEI